MIQPWRVLTAVAVLHATIGLGAAAAQSVVARHVPAGEQVEVMLNGKNVGSAVADAAGNATIKFNMRDATGKTELDANIYVDRCDTTHRVWIVEIGGALPSEGTCNLRTVSGLYWVRPVSTIVVNDVTAAVPSVLLLKGSYTPPEPGEEKASAAPREFPAGLVLFGGAGFAQTTDVTAPQCGDLTDCSGDEGGIGFSGGVEYRFNRVLSAEVTYLKPPAATVSGGASTFRFTSEQNEHVFGLAGKVGVPIGLAKLYGRGGTIYNQAKIETTQTQDPRTVTVDDVEQTIPGGTQTFVVKTDGWGWLFGGGIEVWFRPSFAIYGEVDYSSLTGDDVDGGEAKIKNRVGSAIGGLRVLIGK